jgi:ankyrin repeat protein
MSVTPEKCTDELNLSPAKRHRRPHASPPQRNPQQPPAVHSILCLTADRKGRYKLPMTPAQNDYADKIFADYVSRDILGVNSKHADAAEKKRISRERARARRQAVRVFFTTPFSASVRLFKRKRQDWRNWRRGLRRVTNKRRARFFEFCAENKTGMVRVYLKSGHPIDDIDQNGRSGLHHAASESSATVVRELLKRGAQVDPREKIRNATPLWYSALVKDTQSAHMLIDNRADVDAIDAINGHTPLMLSAISNNLNLAERLIEEGAFLTMQDQLGMTPLHHAAWHGHTSMVFMLLEADHEIGGARDIRDNAGNLPLDWAYTHKNKESAKLLRFGLDNGYMSDDDYLYW